MPKTTASYTKQTLITVGVLSALGGAALGAVVTSVTTPRATVAPSQPSVNASSRAFELGRTAQTMRGNRVTAFSWTPDVKWPVEPSNGKGLSQIDVKWCGATGEQAVSIDTIVGLWSLEMPDGTRISADRRGFRSDDLATQFGVDVIPGDCARGKIVFQTPKGETPEFILFSGVQTVKWRVA